MLEKTKDISVIIPTYRPGQYLMDCLEALYGQDLPQEQYEVIVVLNGPLKPYIAAIEQFRNAHPTMNMRLYTTPEAGVSRARNIGLDHAGGEYICFIDDDDWVSPSYLSELLQVANVDTVALSHTLSVDAEDVTHILSDTTSDDYHKFAAEGRQVFYHPRRFFSGPCMKLLHRDIIGDRRFDTNFHNGEDSLFMFLISDRMRYATFTSANAIYYYRRRLGSATHTMNMNYRIRVSLRLMVQYTRIYCTHIKQYNAHFYITRMLGAIRTLLTH